MKPGIILLKPFPYQVKLYEVSVWKCIAMKPDTIGEIMPIWFLAKSWSSNNGVKKTPKNAGIVNFLGGFKLNNGPRFSGKGYCEYTGCIGEFVSIYPVPSQANKEINSGLWKNADIMKELDIKKWSGVLYK